MAVYRRIKGGKCSCGKGGDSVECSCERFECYSFCFRFGGREYRRQTDCTTKAGAEKIEAAFLRGLRGERSAEVLAFLNGDESRMRRVCASIGEVMDAYKAHWRQWLKSEKAAMRNVNDLALVVAHALGLWAVNEGGRRGTKMGAAIPDLDRIRPLSCGRLNRDLVRGYFLARQRAAGIVDEEAGVLWREAPEHAGFNSTLDHAGDVFSSSAREYALSKLRLPELTEFVKAKRLPEGEALPEPFSAREFDALCGCFDALREADADLWLMNVIHRQTGMRPAYVMGLRGAWLVQGEGERWFIELRARPEQGFEKKRDTLNQFIPITGELRGVIAARGEGLTIAGSATATARGVLQKRHNKLIKATIGDDGAHGQGAYRYRDTVASALAHLKGVDAAQSALGHTTATTTLKHYARALPGVSELMKEELRAWL